MTMDPVTQLRRRYNQLRNILSEGGSRALLDRARRAIAMRVAPDVAPLGVRLSDVLAADLEKPRRRSLPPLRPNQPMIVNWITTPPASGSGGHTTLFRLIEYLERVGSCCRVYIYDVYGGDAAYFRTLVSEVFPNFKGTVEDVTKGMANAHAVVATSWPTAYPAYNDPCQGERFYLVQDFEPWFYPPGGQSTLAENTYRMGFHAITAGQFLANKLTAEYGMTANAFEFGCDTDKYNLLDTKVKRDGVIFYAKPNTPRRAFELGLIALQIFAARRPDLIIHLYGSQVSDVPFPCVSHGVLRPGELNQLYNSCLAGLSLSMTNVSLVPHEMLSAGCIPVVNDATHNRIVLDNPFVRYASATPHSLAGALLEVCSTSDFVTLAANASASVSSMSWLDAGSVAERSIRSVVTDQAATALVVDS
jgi:hypothetical protein